MKKIIRTLALTLLFSLTVQAHNDHGRHGRHRHDHRDSAYVSNTKITMEYNVKVGGQDYKFVFSNDSTIKVNNDKEYDVKNIRPGMCIINWPDKDGNVLNNIIDWRLMKMYTTKLSDKNAATITSGIGYKKTIEVAPPIDNPAPKAKPVQKN